VRSLFASILDGTSQLLGLRTGRLDSLSGNLFRRAGRFVGRLVMLVAVVDD
jgi:hypothetical protein